MSNTTKEAPVSNEENKIEELRKIVKEQREQISAMEGFLKEIGTPPFTLGSALAVSEKTLLIGSPSGDLVEMNISTSSERRINPGDIVTINNQGMIVGTSTHEVYGEKVTITKILDPVRLLIEQGGSETVIFKPSTLDVEEGDSILLDPSGLIALKSLGKEAAQDQYDRFQKIEWDQIGGLREQKEMIREAIEAPMIHANIYKKFGRRPCRGILLYGPPGCGKTIIAKAIATSVEKISGRETNFVYLRGPELLHPLVGVTERKIRELFSNARQLRRKSGATTIIFIDEAESILPRRGSRRSSDVDRTTVPQFLAEMDGMEENSALFILATNREDALDPAVTREGRIDRKIKIPRPGRESCEQILRIHISRIPHECKDTLTNGALEILYATGAYPLYDVGFKDQQDPAYIRMELRDFVSGGMIATLVDEATSVAIRECIQKRRKKHEVIIEDFAVATSKMYQQYAQMDMRSTIADFFEEREVSQIKKLIAR